MERVIKVKEIVPPKDYNQLKLQVKNLKRENDNLKKIISEGRFSDLENMSTSLRIYVNMKCKAIAFEFSSCKYSKKNRENLNDLIETLEASAKQLKGLL